MLDPEIGVSAPRRVGAAFGQVGRPVWGSLKLGDDRDSRSTLEAEFGLPVARTRPQQPVPAAEFEHALLQGLERAVTYLVAQRLDERRSADGRYVGIQSTLTLGKAAEHSIDLYALVDGLAAGTPTGASNPFLSARDRDLWQGIGREIKEKLGFPLEPELFSNMLFVAHAGSIEHYYVRRLCDQLLSTFRDSDANGLYHFFTSLRFACDIDCTAVAARARIVSGDLELASVGGRAALRKITDRILRSAAVQEMTELENRTHSKDNGPLHRWVFKVYVEDHKVQGSEYDRGLKNNPVVAANALFPVLYELKYGLRQVGEFVPLKEYVAGNSIPRVGTATVGDLTAANISYCTHHLLSGAWRGGCRYYPSPDAFLCSYSECLREFPELFLSFNAREALLAAIQSRRKSRTRDAAQRADASLNLALRAIAATNIGVDPHPELELLLARQHPDGSWKDLDLLYTLGSVKEIPVYFSSDILTAAFAIRALSGASPPAQSLAVRSRTWIDAIVAHAVPNLAT